MRVQLNINSENFYRFYRKDFDQYRVKMFTLTTAAIIALLLYNYVDRQRQHHISYKQISKNIALSPLYGISNVVSKAISCILYIKNSICQPKSGDDAKKSAEETKSSDT